MDLAQCKGLTLKSKLIYLALERLHGEPTSSRAIAAEVGMSLSSVERAVRELRELGLLDVVRHGSRPSQYFLKSSEVVDEIIDKGYTESVPLSVTQLDEWRELMAAKNRGGGLFVVTAPTVTEDTTKKPMAWLTTFTKAFHEIKGTKYVVTQTKDYAALKRIRAHIPDDKLEKAMRLFIETEKTEYCTLSNMSSQRSLTKLLAELDAQTAPVQAPSEESVEDKLARLQARMVK